MQQILIQKLLQLKINSIHVNMVGMAANTYYCKSYSDEWDKHFCKKSATWEFTLRHFNVLVFTELPVAG